MGYWQNEAQVEKVGFFYKVPLGYLCLNSIPHALKKDPFRRRKPVTLI